MPVLKFKKPVTSIAAIPANDVDPDDLASDAEIEAEWIALQTGKIKTSAYHYANDFFEKQKSGGKFLSASAVVAASKSAANKCWSVICADDSADFVAEMNAKGMHAVVFHEFKKTFDAIHFKAQTGEELPLTKDGYKPNTKRKLREATGTGDAASLLHSIRYWSPRANKKKDGIAWIANTHQFWADDTGIPKTSIKAHLERLTKLGFVETKASFFNGTKMLHVRLTEAGKALFS